MFQLLYLKYPLNILHTWNIYFNKKNPAFSSRYQVFLRFRSGNPNPYIYAGKQLYFCISKLLLLVYTMFCLPSHCIAETATTITIADKNKNKQSLVITILIVVVFVIVMKTTKQMYICIYIFICKWCGCACTYEYGRQTKGYAFGIAYL